ncbi:MAG: polymorphic toxin-type HINT domain-containing protein [Isosphaerales bacterium]
MVSMILMCCGLLGADDTRPSAGPSGKPAVEAYQAAQAKAGKNAADQVRLALWCEAHGLSAERMKHLALAVVYDPSHALARGLLGLVSYQGEWKKPDQVSRAVQDDPDTKARIQEYLQRRAQLRERADDHWKLALWCEQNGLKQQATAHLYQVLRLDRSREAAWKHLGFRRLGGHWDKPERVAAAKAEARVQQKANNHWKPILEKWRNALQSKDASRHHEAERGLSQVNDRLAVPMVWATFAKGSSSLQKVAVQVLGQIDDASASRSLVMLAVFGGSVEVRALAIGQLKRRDAREYARTLIAMILQTIKYEVKPVRGPGQPGELLIKGQGSTPNLRRIYAPPPGPSTNPQAGDRVFLDENGLPVIDRVVGYSTLQTQWINLMATQQQQLLGAQQQLNAAPHFLAQSGLGGPGQKIGHLLINAFESYEHQLAIPQLSANPFIQMGVLSQDGLVPLNPGSLLTYTIANGVQIPVGRMTIEAQKTAAVAQRQLQDDVDAIKQFNASFDEINDRVVAVLKDISGLDIGPDSFAWLKWFNNLVGFNQLQASEPSTVIENVPLAYQPEPIPLGTFSGPISVKRMSCFGAGTMVRTLSGLEPIEALKVGDEVLAQSSKTGALAYKPILVVHHNPPSKTYLIKLGEETIVSSYFHRFWKAGSGWVMARDLKVGDPIRTLSGTVKVTAIEEGKVVPVFNLDVADDGDFFVGELGALAHDNTLPNLRETPFDAFATLSNAAAASSRD